MSSCHSSQMNLLTQVWLLRYLLIKLLRWWHQCLDEQFIGNYSLLELQLTIPHPGVLATNSHGLKLSALECLQLASAYSKGRSSNGPINLCSSNLGSHLLWSNHTSMLSHHSTQQTWFCLGSCFCLCFKDWLKSISIACSSSSNSISRFNDLLYCLWWRSHWFCKVLNICLSFDGFIPIWHSYTKSHPFPWCMSVFFTKFIYPNLWISYFISLSPRRLISQYLGSPFHSLIPADCHHFWWITSHAEFTDAQLLEALPNSLQKVVLSRLLNSITDDALVDVKSNSELVEWILTPVHIQQCQMEWRMPPQNPITLDHLRALQQHLNLAKLMHTAIWAITVIAYAVELVNLFRNMAIVAIELINFHSLDKDYWCLRSYLCRYSNWQWVLPCGCVV